MQSALYAPAPSSRLLRFLRVQSEAICFFTSNPRSSFSFDSAAPRGPYLTTNPLKGTPSRCLSTTAPCRATVEAGFLNLEFLWPQPSTSALQHPTAQCRNTARSKHVGYGKGLSGQRKSSTKSNRWLQKLWGVTSSKGGRPLRPDDLPSTLRGRDDMLETSVFSLGRAVSAKAAAQPKLRCTELDEQGNVVLASGEFKKSELIAKVRLFHPLITLFRC